jgi:hypothetical protein
LDDYVLLGGFERGSVVGVSAEEEEVGMVVSFVFFGFLCLLLSVDGWDCGLGGGGV